MRLRWRSTEEKGEAAPAGFSLAGFRSDVIAGLTFAMVNVPQSLGHALLASVNPVFGIYTLIVAMPVGAVFTGSVFMNVSTTSSLCVATAAVLGGYEPETRAQALVSLVFLVGVIQLLAGIFRLGYVVRFVSHSVMTGFLNGIAVLIVLGQLGTLTGFRSTHTNRVAQAWDLVANAGQLNPLVTAVGVGTLALIGLLLHTRLRKFAFLVSIVVVTLAVALLGGEAVPTVGDMARVSTGLPRLTFPPVAFFPELLLGALSVSIVGLMQGAGVSQGYPNPDGRYPDTSRDFRGQGAANLAAGLFQGVPAGGSISGTSVIVGAGARSRWANILAGLSVAAIVLLVGPAVERVPLAALAGLLVMVGSQALRLTDVRMVWRTGRVSTAAMGITFVTALLVPLHYAVLVGVALHILLHVARQADRVLVKELVFHSGGLPEERPAPKQLAGGRVTVLQVYGSLFWAAARRVEEMLPLGQQGGRAAVVLVLRGHSELGATFFNVLTRYARSLAASGDKLLLAGLDESVRRQLRETGALDAIGATNIYPATARYGEALLRATQAGKEWIDRGGDDTGRTAVVRRQHSMPKEDVPDRHGDGGVPPGTQKG